MRKDVYLQLRKDHDFAIKHSQILKHIGTDAVLLSAITYLCQAGTGPNFLAIPLISIFMFRSFSLMHEAVHGLVSKNKKLNNFIGLVYGSFSALPFEPWKKSHLDHHFWSGNYQKDPVMALITILPKWSEKSIRVLNFLWQSWVPVLAFMQYVVFWLLSIKTTMSSKKSLSSVLNILVPLTLFASLVGFLSAATLLQVLAPAVVLYLMAVDVVK